MSAERTVRKAFNSMGRSGSEAAEAIGGACYDLFCDDSRPLSFFRRVDELRSQRPPCRRMQEI